MLRPNKRTTILLVAGVVACGLTAGLVLGGGSVGGSLGAIGRGVIENTVGLFAYSNKSTDAGKSFQKAKPSVARRAGAGGQTGAADAATASVSGMTLDTTSVTPTPLSEDPTMGAASDAATEGAPEAYTDATVGPPLEENDVTIDPGSEEWEEGDEFAFDDEHSLRTEGPSYRAMGKKDPFYAMVTSKEQKAASSELLDPDRLRLVGVIWGKEGIGALVEDGRGRGYCLHEGDRVLFGRVISVTRDKCVVHQVIYGEFKTVELRLMTQREEE